MVSVKQNPHNEYTLVRYKHGQTFPNVDILARSSDYEKLAVKLDRLEKAHEKAFKHADGNLKRRYFQIVKTQDIIDAKKGVKNSYLKTYEVTFTGRESGAIGKFYTIKREVYAESKEAAKQYLFDSQSFEVNQIKKVVEKRNKQNPDTYYKIWDRKLKRWASNVEFVTKSDANDYMNEAPKMDRRRYQIVTKLKKQNFTVTDKQNPIADLVKTLELGGSTYRIYKPDTKRNFPYFLEVKHSNGVVEDLGFYKTVEAATKAAEYRYNKYYKKNFTVTDFKKYSTNKLQSLARMFQGATNGEKRRVLESDYTPKDKYRLGHLVQMTIKQGSQKLVIDFEGESFLAADAKNNLYAVGKDARIDNTRLPKKGHLRLLGKLIQVDYVTAKKHIEGGKTIRFYHKLGEATKEFPSVFVDHDGFLIIQGGNYDIWDVGIVN